MNNTLYIGVTGDFTSDDLKKKLHNVERKKLELRNSQYEPPATIQQAELRGRLINEAEARYRRAKWFQISLTDSDFVF